MGSKSDCKMITDKKGKTRRHGGSFGKRTFIPIKMEDDKISLVGIQRPNSMRKVIARELSRREVEKKIDEHRKQKQLETKPKSMKKNFTDIFFRKKTG